MPTHKDHSTAMGFPLTILSLVIHYLWELRLFYPQSKLEASGTAVEQWVKQAKLEDANEYWTLLAHSSFSDSNIVTLPESISRSPRLELLDIDNCKQLREIPRLPQSMGMVDARNCIGLDPKTSNRLLNQLRSLSLSL
ncbi:dynein regulatory complex subunit 7-like [Quercus suber]|uniref:dynein regulatory complex subunit 7-like n=1 Tax=Quercus suber TaxID=58331 RepID=UPI0032E00401